MNGNKKLLKKLARQEEDLQFTRFTSESALKIGLSLIEKAKKDNKKIAIDITRCGHQLFHYAFDGTSPDNDQWIIRKNRVVNRFHKSSLHIGILLLDEDRTIEEKSFVDSFEYSAHGGAFPIIIKDTGIIGTITVSGLAQEEDHNMVVTAIEDYLQKELRESKNG